MHAWEYFTLDTTTTKNQLKHGPERAERKREKLYFDDVGENLGELLF